MKIAVNCWVLRNKQTDGIGNFTIETLRPLILAHPEIDFIILCDKNFTESYFEFPNARIVRLFPAIRHPLLYIYYLEWVLPSYLKKNPVDMVLSMDGFLTLRTSVPQLQMIYDLNFEHYPKDLLLRNRVYFRFFFRRFAKKATRIATISEYTKTDIHKQYGIPFSKVDNVSCGIRDSFKPLDEIIKQEVKKTYTSNEDYFFFIGSMHPRKNIARLITAFSLFKKNTGSTVKLVLAGHLFWNTGSIREAMEQSEFKTDIVFTGRVGDRELMMLLGSALALTYVPTFEGFGLPIVEAFRSGVPVICSNTTSMPEVAGDAAVFVNPFDVKAIADSMEKLYIHPALREGLVKQGHEQKLLFSWEKTADKLYDCIMKAAPPQALTSNI